MRDLAQWLEKLGMSEYAQRFAENRIDLSVLPDLTEQDLKELGIVLGDRRKILRAIARLDATAPSETPNQSPIPSDALVAPVAPAEEASIERHHMTVLQC